MRYSRSTLTSLLVLAAVANAMPGHMKRAIAHADADPSPIPKLTIGASQPSPAPAAPAPANPAPAPAAAGPANPAPAPAAPGPAAPAPNSPAPAPNNPAPAPVNPAPAPANPAPAPVTPAPAPNSPAPAPANPAPVPANPAPAPANPAPAPVNPTPTPANPAPAPANPAPAPVNPAPAPVNPAPAPAPVNPAPAPAPVNPSPVTPPTTSPSPGSCGAISKTPTYIDTNAIPYTLQCAMDRGGGDLQANSSSSFQGCFPICDATAGCVGFSYTGGNGAGTCYLKSTLNVPSTNNFVDSAYNSKPSTYVAPKNPGSCGAIASTSAVGSAVPFTDANGNQYTVACGSDLSGTTMGTAASPTFLGCFALCDATPNCQAFAYLPGTCYFKSYAGVTSSSSNVNAAYMKYPGGLCQNVVTTTVTVGSVATPVKVA